MLAEIEDKIIEKIKAEFGSTLRSVESHPGKWDDKTLRQIAAALPGAYVAFEDGTARKSQDAQMIGEWCVYAATAHANGEAKRRRGDGNRQLGAYQIIERVIPLLHGCTIVNIGTLEFLAVRSLLSFALEDKGVTIYQIRFSLNSGFDINRTAALERFEKFHAEHQLAGEAEDMPPRAVEDVSIPQE
jgi:phage gp37-like protein